MRAGLLVLVTWLACTNALPGNLPGHHLSSKQSKQQRYCLPVDHRRPVTHVETQKASIPAPLSWRSSIAPEVIQLTRTLMSLYQPSKCLVIGWSEHIIEGVFTGLGLLGVAEQVESRGFVMALEHPSYVQFWENIGLESARTAGLSYALRIQLRSSEPIEKALPKLAANEPDNFDFILLDDLRRQNYLDDYEHAVRLLRPGGLLIINQALNNGGVLTGIELMNENDRVMSVMNIRIKDDGRVRASLLPFGGGTWIILKK
ncbi:O-methyltransferase [Oesophagostomum dentatum]|uniref:O-methyltransferase n=1 Tax=Oesophagostomum dentatum TaxID=61180 RepID=A0A0B1TQA9_OESDE|nr:O-methyltransferase [Oesophagostomum dentatum]